MARIILIDSEETVRTVVTEILARDRHCIQATGDFREALALIQKIRPDLVMTNVFLRGIEGHEAMLELKERFPELKVLMVTGLPDEDVIRNWTGQPGFDIFLKPFSPTALQEKVREVLET